MHDVICIPDAATSASFATYVEDTISPCFHKSISFPPPGHATFRNAYTPLQKRGIHCLCTAFVHAAIGASSHSSTGRLQALLYMFALSKEADEMMEPIRTWQHYYRNWCSAGRY
jgi:hypothetical protein